MSSLEERIQRLEDREAIREVLAHYNRGVDERDEELFLSLWEDDAQYLIGGPYGNHVGIEAIRDFLLGLWTTFSELHHWATNVVISVEGNAATARCDADVTGTDMKGRALMFAASYKDQLSKTDGVWKFAVRDVTLHYMTPVLEPWSTDPDSRYAAL